VNAIDVVLLIISVAIQIGAVYLSWKLIRRSTRSLPWVAVTIALLFMVLRRVLSLLGASLEIENSIEYFAAFEGLGLAISLLLFVGLFYSTQFIDHLDEVERSKESAIFIQDLLAHDIYNYNYSALAYLELLEVDIKDGGTQRAHFIGALREAIMTNTQLVKNVQSLSKVQSGTLKPHPVKLKPLIDDAEKTVRMAYQHIPFSVEMKDLDWDAVTVQGHDILREVFINVFTNAIKHRKPHQTKVTVELEANTTEEDVVLSIKDYGKGVPDEEKETVFERHVGGGLGLSLVRTILNTFDGLIGVKNHPGEDYSKGTILWVKMPRAALGVEKTVLNRSS
jgi:signal transduction histidine kinase